MNKFTTLQSHINDLLNKFSCFTSHLNLSIHHETLYQEADNDSRHRRQRHHREEDDDDGDCHSRRRHHQDEDKEVLYHLCGLFGQSFSMFIVLDRHWCDAFEI